MSWRKPPSQRQLRVGEELRHAIAEVLQRGKLRDPVLAEVHYTVSEVRATPDLRRATVFVVALGGGDDAVAFEALRRAAPFVRSEVAKRVKLRFTPELEFRRDESFDEADRIERALRRPDVARDLAGGPDGRDD